MHAKVGRSSGQLRRLVGAGLFTYVAGNLDSGSFQLSHETCSITDCWRKKQNKEKNKTKQNKKLINPNCIGVRTAPAPPPRQRCEQAARPGRAHACSPLLLLPPSNTHGGGPTR